MNLPNYFLADLPVEATLSATMVDEAVQSLLRNREKYLAGRSTASIIRMLAELAENWLQPDYDFRQEALSEGPHATGFSAGTIGKGLDAFFEQLTEKNLNALIEQELGHPHRLDKMVSTESELRSNGASRVITPNLLVHVAAGTLPNSTFSSMVLGLLLRSAQFVKCGSGSSFLPRMFAHSLYELDPKAGACLELVQWPGGSSHLEDALFAGADCITAMGSDETLEKIKQRLPSRTRFIGYGHRLSFGFISGQDISTNSMRKIADRAAEDVAAWDQQGCLSPHVIYIEREGRITPEFFAEALAEALERRESDMPRGNISLEASTEIASRRAVYEMRSHTGNTRLWHSQGNTAWTVVFEDDPLFQTSCLNRFIYVKAATDLTEAIQGADAIRGKVSTVGVAASEEKMRTMAEQLAEWGVSRICPLGKMQRPPISWRHDGRPALGDFVTWSGLEL